MSISKYFSNFSNFSSSGDSSVDGPYNRATEPAFLRRLNAVVVAGPMDIGQFLALDGLAGVVQFAATGI